MLVRAPLAGVAESEEEVARPGERAPRLGDMRFSPTPESGRRVSETFVPSAGVVKQAVPHAYHNQDKEKEGLLTE